MTEPKPLTPGPIRAEITTSLFIDLTIPPGVWIRDSWSITHIRFEIYAQGGRWYLHVSPANFRAVRRPDNYRGKHHQYMGVWTKTPAYPGFSPKVEMIPANVIAKVREIYEAQGVSPEFLPPFDTAKGKGPAR